MIAWRKKGENDGLTLQLVVRIRSLDGWLFGPFWPPSATFWPRSATFGYAGLRLGKLGNFVVAAPEELWQAESKKSVFFDRYPLARM